MSRYKVEPEKYVIYPYDWVDSRGLGAFLEQTMKSNYDGAYVGFRGIGARLRKPRCGSQDMWWWFQKVLKRGEYEYERLDADTFIPAEWYWMNPEGLSAVIEKAKDSGENGDIITFAGLTVKLKTNKSASPYHLNRDLWFEPQLDNEGASSA